MLTRKINFRVLLALIAFLATGVIARADVTVKGTVSDAEGPLIGV